MEYVNKKNIEKFLVIMAIIGGFRVVLNKFAITNGFGPYSITAAQSLIGAAILSIYLRSKIFSLNKKYFISALFASVIFFLSNYLVTSGLVYTTPSKNVFLCQTSVVFIPILYYFVYKQKIDIHTIIGVAVAMFGLAFLILDNGFGNINIGDLLTILGALMIATHMTFSSFILKKNECDPVAFITIQMFIAGILAFVLAITNDDLSNSLNLTIFWPLLLAGILNGFTFYINSLALKYSTPTKISLIYCLSPVASMVASVIFLKEVVTYRLFVGGGLIMVALFVIQLKPNLLRSVNNAKVKVESF